MEQIIFYLAAGVLIIVALIAGLFITIYGIRFTRFNFKAFFTRDRGEEEEEDDRRGKR